MAVVTVLQAAVGVLTDDARANLAALPLFVGLGSPAQYTDGVSSYFVYADSRLTIEDAARGAVAFANVATMPTVPEGESAKSYIRAWADGLGWEVPTIPEGEDPFAYTLAHNSAPASLGMFQTAPTGWEPMDTP